MRRLIAASPFIVLLLFTACGPFEQEPAPTETPTVEASTTVLAPATAVTTPVSPPSISDFPPATPAPVTPVAESDPLARTDCPSGWVTYRDHALVFSFCGPPDFPASSDVSELGQPRMSVASELDGQKNPNIPRVALTVGLSTGPIFTPSIPLEELCASLQQSGLENGKAVEMTVSGLVARGCDGLIELHAVEGPLESLNLSAELPVVGVGTTRYLNLVLNWRVEDPQARDFALQLLGALRYER